MILKLRKLWCRVFHQKIQILYSESSYTVMKYECMECHLIHTIYLNSYNKKVKNQKAIDIVAQRVDENEKMQSLSSK